MTSRDLLLLTRCGILRKSLEHHNPGQWFEHAPFNIPLEDHVMRHVPWSKLRKDENDNVIGCNPQAFELRPGEDALSVTWLEYFDGGRSSQVYCAAGAIRRTQKVGRKAGFVIAEVQAIHAIAQTRGVRVRIVHEPDDKNPAHCGIRRLPREDTKLLEALAATAITELLSSAEVPAGACFH